MRKAMRSQPIKPVHVPEGVVEEAQPGSVIYAAYGISNRIWNSGTTTARYCVIQIGGDAKA